MIWQVRVQTLGEKHPDTLTSRNNLAAILADLGRLEKAESEHRAVWQTMVQVLGEEHPATLNSRNNLAAVLAESRAARGGRRGVPGVLVARVRALGEKHPDTLASRKNLDHIRVRKYQSPQTRAPSMAIYAATPLAHAGRDESSSAVMDSASIRRAG